MINHAEMGSPAPNAKPGALTQRPSVGPVVPITAINVRSDELRGGISPGNRPPATDLLLSRVLAKGEPISALSGRADDFSWPRTSGVNIDTSPLEKTPTPSSASVLVQENFVFEAEVR
jgi:hypothetical protein